MLTLIEDNQTVKGVSYECPGNRGPSFKYLVFVFRTLFHKLFR